MTFHPITRGSRTAPKQDAVITSVRELIRSRDSEVPEDGYDRVDYRLEIVLESMYDAATIDPTQDQFDQATPVVDLLSDLQHLAAARGWDIAELFARAQNMREQEIEEWGDRG